MLILRKFRVASNALFISVNMRLFSMNSVAIIRAQLVA